MSHHQAIDPRVNITVFTIYAAGLYAVSERDLGVKGVEYRVTHTPTGVVLWRPWRAQLACDIADTFHAAFPNVGADLPWGAIETLAAALHAAGDPDAILSRILATDNPHGEPPPNPCTTCGRVKEKP